MALNEVFRNQLVTSYQILSKDAFAKLKLKFSCEKDPIKDTPINLEFASGEFNCLPAKTGLF